MNNYDFRSLNDKEFESFCTDLLGSYEGRRFERFKPGRDQGVDGRFFTSDGGEVVLQCKHWAGTPVKDLIARLRKDELPKVNKLQPKRYIIAVSNPLGRVEKRAIRAAFDPFILSEDDVFGNEDLNDIMGRNPEVERRHYKLWLQSSAVLSNILNLAIIGRSDFALTEIHQRSSRYVVTENHDKALEQLERLGVVVVTGEPGVGKTTLAEQLCLHYIASGFQFAQLIDNVSEAESIFDTEALQVFYFDDFLGRNYLEAMSGRDGTHVAQFIRRIASNKNKRFVLTSRSNILNQGKVLIDAFETSNLRRNEYELKITSLSGIDRARILYNHIWFSGLDRAYVDELYENRRYREIVKHRNFNPRLISFITDASRLDGVSASGYWGFVEQSLDNPKQIWEHAFVSQQDDFCRVIVVLVVISRQPITEEDLMAAYNRVLALPDSATLHGRRDFLSNVRILLGTFLSRTVDENGRAKYSIFNPSVADYVLGRIGNDGEAVGRAVIALRSANALSTLFALEREGRITSSVALRICSAAVVAVQKDAFPPSSLYFLAWAARKVVEQLGPESRHPGWLSEVVAQLSKDQGLAPSEDFFRVVEVAFDRGLLSVDDVTEFVSRNQFYLTTDDEFTDALRLLNRLPTDGKGVRDVWGEIEAQVSSVASADIDEFIDLAEVFDSVAEDYEAAYDLATDAVQDKLAELGFSDVSSLAQDIVFHSSFEAKFQKHLESLREPDYEYEGGSSRPHDALGSDAAIDDLFDRS